MKRSNLLVTVGVAVFLLGGAIVLLVLRDTGNNTSSVSSTGGVSQTALVATRDIEAGTSGKDVLSSGAVRPGSIATTDAVDAVTSSSSLTGQVLAIPVKKGDVIRAGDLRPETIKIPDGMQAIAVQVDFVPAVAGQVGAGDLVSVYANGTRSAGAAGSATFSRLLLSNLLVLKVSQLATPAATAATAAPGQPAATTAPAAGPPTVFILAVNAEQAEKLIYATTNQRLYATLVPKGQPAAVTPGRTEANLFQ